MKDKVRFELKKATIMSDGRYFVEMSVGTEPVPTWTVVDESQIGTYMHLRDKKTGKIVVSAIII